MTNFIPEICETLGLEIGEKFKVDLSRWSGIYYFNNNGLIGKTYTDHWIPCPELFVMIVAGSAKIIKLPWKPKQDETFYTFGIHATEDKWVVVSGKWWNNVKNLALYKIGWIYRSQAEAEAALPKVAKEMGVGININRALTAAEKAWLDKIYEEIKREYIKEHGTW